MLDGSFWKVCLEIYDEGSVSGILEYRFITFAKNCAEVGEQIDEMFGEDLHSIELITMEMLTAKGEVYEIEEGDFD